MTGDVFQIKIKMTNPIQESSGFSKAPNQELKGMGVLSIFKNQDREPKFRTWLYQRPVVISKSKSRFQTPARNLQCPPKPQIRT